VVRFYNTRGTAEQWIKESKEPVKMTRLSRHRFRSNEVRLWLSVVAYNLGNLSRRLVLPGGSSSGRDKFAAAIGENGRMPDQACPLLLAPVGRGSFDEAAVLNDAPADRGAAVACGTEIRSSRAKI
jgi:hypothetical protein